MTKSLAASLCLAALAVAPSALSAKAKTNRQVIDRFFEVVDNKQFDKLGEVDAPDLVLVLPMGTVKGPEGHKQVLKQFAAAIPNFKHRDHRCVESGDTIACEGKFGGDHTGPMMTPDGKSIPATNKHVEFPYAGFARIKNGKVGELHVYFDMMAFMQQLTTPAAKAANR